MALITLADFKSLYWHGNGSDADTRLQQWLDSLEEVFLEYIGVPLNDAGARDLSTSTYTVIFGGDLDVRVKYGAGGHVVPPVVGWSTTTLHSSTDGDFTAAELHAATEYDDRMVNDAREVRVKLRPGYSFVDGAEVKLVGTGGYSTVPDRYIHAFALAVDWWDRTHGHRGERTSTKQNRPTRSFVDEQMPADIREMWDACLMPWERF